MHHRLILKAQGKKKKKANIYNSDVGISSDDEEILNKFLGNIYNNRYITIKFIGKGTFSRLWLVYDIIDDEYNVLKLQNNNDIDEGKNEIKLLQNIDHINITKIKDHFYNETGNELGIVFDILGDNLFTLFDIYDNHLPLEMIKIIFRQILSGVNCMHNNKIIHADLKLENILLDIINPNISNYINWFKSKLDNNLSNIIDDLLPEDYNDTPKDKRKRIKRKVRIKAFKIICNTINKILLEDYEKVDIKYNEKDIQNINIKIIDLGNSELENNISNDEIAFKYYRSPENILGYNYDTKSDIWSLGCIFYELITKEYLIKIAKSKNNTDRDRLLLREMHKYFGRIPKDFALNSEFSEDLFDNKGKILRYKNIEEKSLKTKDNIESILGDETNIFLDLLLNMMKYDPKERFNCIQCLEHLFLNN